MDVVLYEVMSGQHSTVGGLARFRSFHEAIVVARAANKNVRGVQR